MKSAFSNASYNTLAFSKFAVLAASIVSALLILFTTLSLISQKVHFNIVAIDPIGRASKMPSLQEVQTLPQRSYEQFATEFIRRLRRISSDQQIIIQDMQVTEQLTIAGSRAFEAYNAMENTDPTQQRLKKYTEITRSVRPLRVFKSTEGKWVVEWIEDTFDYGSGRMRKQARYQASLLIRQKSDMSDAHLKANPLALGVYAFDLQRITQRTFDNDTG